MAIHQLRNVAGVLAFALALTGCSSSSSTVSLAQTGAKPALPPEPVVNHSPKDAQPGQRIEHGELIVDVDDATRHLNAQHHSYAVLETRKVPGPFQSPAMTDVKTSRCPRTIWM